MESTMKLRTLGRILTAVVVGAFAITTLAIGGQEGWGRVTPTGSEKCRVSPDPTTNGQEIFTVSGSGFRPGQPLAILVEGAGWLLAAGDYSGSFSSSAWAAFSRSGTHAVSVYQSGDRRMTVLASCSFQVQ
jgi:hypothetical protein